MSRMETTGRGRGGRVARLLTDAAVFAAGLALALPLILPFA